MFNITLNNRDTKPEKLIANSEIKRWFDETYLAYFYEPTAGLNTETTNSKTAEKIKP